MYEPRLPAPPSDVRDGVAQAARLTHSPAPRRRKWSVERGWALSVSVVQSPRGGGTSPGVSCSSGPLRLRGPEGTMDNKGKLGRVVPAGPRAEPRRDSPHLTRPDWAPGAVSFQAQAVWSDVVPLVTTKTPSLLVYPGNGSWVYPQTSLLPTLSSALQKREISDECAGLRSLDFFICEV